MSPDWKQHLSIGLAVALAGLCAFGLKSVHRSASAHTATAQGPTIIHVDDTVLHDHVLRLGMNLGGQSYYSSRQVLRNLISRNPGFEAQHWQSVLHCVRASATTCTDSTTSTVWPEGFLDGGTYEVILGAAKGLTGTITHSTAKGTDSGITIQFSPASTPLAANNTIVVRKTVTEGSPAGWKPYLERGGAVSAETTDLFPGTRGKQAVRLTASSPGQLASISQYFDSTAGQSFLRLRGAYIVRFRAKALAGDRTVSVSLRRVTSDGSGKALLEAKVPLTAAWQDYSLPFTASEADTPVAMLGFGFTAYGSDILLDDASLSLAGSNGTAFRDEVVDALQRLRPGVLRYMDSGGNYGSTLDNMLAPAEARQPSGFSTDTLDPEDIPIGLHDFLTLAQKIGAEPWYTLQIGTSEAEVHDLMDYLAGSATTRYGAIRAALGHPAPWTESFSTIHIEYGNEAWNTVQKGAVIPDPADYAARAAVVFQTIRTSPFYNRSSFDLIANGWAINGDWNRGVIGDGSHFDTLDIAPYTFGTFADDTSTEHIFGPMFAEPEMLTRPPKGSAYAQTQIAAHARKPVKIAVYEANIDSRYGTVGQASLDAAVPSLGAGLTTVEGMLLMLRDLGITVQNTFQLSGTGFPFWNSATQQQEDSPIWAAVVDLGGPTNHVRPLFLAEQLANQAIRSEMLATRITGKDPTWDQPLSSNNKVKLEGAHELQAFAFTDNRTDTVIVFNLSRTEAHAVAFEGNHVPQGTVIVQTLTSAKITGNNEKDEEVRMTSRTETNFLPRSSGVSLAPFSMTVLSSAHKPHPVSR